MCVCVRVRACVCVYSNPLTCPHSFVFDQFFTFWHCSVFSILFWNIFRCLGKNCKNSIEWSHTLHPAVLLTFYIALVHLSKLRHWHWYQTINEVRNSIQISPFFHWCFSSFPESKLVYPIVFSVHVSLSAALGDNLSVFYVFYTFNTVED